jgi:hypothetical protein
VVRKAWEQVRSVRREYMMFTSNEECLRIVIHPETHAAIQREFWEESRRRGIGAGPFDGFCFEQAITRHWSEPEVHDRMLGIKIEIDKKVPEGEVELRAILAKSWETV